MNDAPRMTNILLRSLAVQLFLNYKTMQGPGYLMSLGSDLRERNEHKVRAAGSFINGHPAFSSIALGALTKRLRGEVTAETAKDISEWKRQISTPLGAIGDSIIWERWKPALLALCVAAMLFSREFAATAWVWAVSAMLLIYNLSLWSFRVWGFRHGYQLGERVAELALHPALPAARRVLRILGIAAAIAVVCAALWTAFAPGTTSALQFGAGFLIMLGAALLRTSTLTACFLTILSSFAIAYFSTSTSLLP